jgi:hypothetical protein
MLENSSFPTILRELALSPTFDTAPVDGSRRSIPPEVSFVFVLYLGNGLKVGYVPKATNKSAQYV